MKYGYDNFGWCIGQSDGDRTTTDVPPACGNGQQPNWTGSQWVCATYVAPPAPAPVSYGDKVTYFALKNRFTQAERIAIKSATASDAQVADVWDLLEATAATYAWLAGTPLKNGLLLLVSKGLITESRRLVIGAYPVTDHRELPAAVRVVYGLPEIPA